MFFHLLLTEQLILYFCAWFRRGTFGGRKCGHRRAARAALRGSLLLGPAAREPAA